MRSILVLFLAVILGTGALYGCGGGEQQPAEQMKEGAEETMEEAGEAAEEVKEEAGEAVEEMKEETGEAVEEMKEGAAETMDEAGSMAEGAMEAAGEMASEAKEEATEMVASAGDANEGSKLYKLKCAACHGAGGKGTAMAPSFIDNEWMADASDEVLTDVIVNGRQGADKRYKEYAIGMPAQKGMSDEEIDDLIAYMRSL